MRRVLSVFLPLWPVERATRRLGPRRGRVLVEATVAQRRVVVHACDASRRAGVRPGMTLAHARALLRGGEPLVLPHDPARDAAGLEALARWATRWSPRVAPDAPDGLLLDVSGCAHLFGGEPALGAAVRAALARLGLTARVACASTVGAAWGVARFGPESLAWVAPGEERAALGPLPLAALRLEPAACEGLAEVGIEHAGALLGLAREAVALRYGAAVLRRIDQALGAAHEGVGRAPQTVEHRAELDLPGGTCDWESVAAGVRAALADLSRRLEERSAGLRRLEAAFHRLDGGRARIAVEVARPTRCPAHLWPLLRPKLEALNMGLGVERITLAAARVERLRPRQGELAPGAGRGGAEGEGLGAALDALVNRLGRERVRRASLRASHRPERACAMTEAVGAPPDGGAAGAAGRAPRPSRLFEPPEAARVVALWPDGPVMSLAWRGGSGRVVSCDGPERIGGEWWAAREGSRDYFRVQDGRGRWLWVFRGPGAEGGGGWYVHGEWA